MSSGRKPHDPHIRCHRIARRSSARRAYVPARRSPHGLRGRKPRHGVSGGSRVAGGPAVALPLNCRSPYKEVLPSDETAIFYLPRLRICRATHTVARRVSRRPWAGSTRLPTIGKLCDESPCRNNAVRSRIVWRRRHWEWLACRLGFFTLDRSHHRHAFSPACAGR